MSEYEKLMLKLKMVELIQNQTMLAFKAKSIGGVEAENAAIISNEVLEMVQNDIEKLLQG